MAEDIYKQVKVKLGDLVKTKQLLAPYTGFKIGGPAEYFVRVKSVLEVVNSIEVAKELGLKVTFLGSGTNILVNSDGLEGLVIKMDNRQLNVKKNQIEAGAGVLMRDLLEVSLLNNLTGLEWAGGLPGTVGGAVYGNSGCFGGETSLNVVKVQAYDRDRVVVYNKDDLNFTYRCSAFKSEKKGQTILSALFLFNDNNDVEESRKTVKDHILNRCKKHPLDKPSAGSVFKNIKLKQGTMRLLEPSQGDLPDKIKKNLPKIFIDRGAIPAAYLIEKAGLKGYSIGGIQVSNKHANFLVNTGAASSDHFIMMVSYIKQQIRDKFGLQLSQEIQLIGF